LLQIFLDAPGPTGSASEELHKLAEEHQQGHDEA
jgi:hypothetical protein